MDWSKKLKALAEENRLKILALLEQEDLCVRSLAHRLDYSEASISQHLKILREAGLVRGEKRGYFVHYTVCEEELINTAEALKQLAEKIEVPKECKKSHEGDCCRKNN